jgi:8-oxo-dGTP diphosphatase
MAQVPILGAGGIVVRSGDKPLVAVVQRRKDDRWVLPKGKLKRDESAIAGAEREVMEETGQDVVVHEFLGAISYMVGGKPKVVQFWRMEAADRPARKLTKDIKAVKWLPLEAAIKKLKDPLEQLFLRNVAERALVIANPISEADAVAEPAPQPGAVSRPAAEQPTALSLPIVEPSFAVAPTARKERLVEPPVVSEPIPKQNVLPMPPAQFVVLTTSAPKPAVLAAPTAEQAPPAVMRPAVELAVVTRSAPEPTVVTKPGAVSPVAAKPGGLPLATRPALTTVAKLAPTPVAMRPSAEPPIAARPVVATQVATKPAAAPPVATKPALPAVPERSVIIPPVDVPSPPLNLFGRVLQRLQLDWTDQRRHWTAGTARRTGR